MKKRLTLWAAGLAILGVALLPLAFRAQPRSPQPAIPAAAATPAAPAAIPAPPQHPRIEAAMRHLEEAKKELQAAPDEFHGHRHMAIVRVDQALDECHKALASVR